MNIKLSLEDASWTLWIAQIRNAMSAKDTLLKKAFLIIWPREGASHFEQELGPEGRWAPWTESTRRQRIAHEIATTSKAQRVRARSSMIREGGRLLQISGRLRTETVQEPEMVELPEGLKVISPTPYSGWLNDGTNKMVARPFMWLGDDAQERLADIMITQIMDKAGGTD